MKAFTHYIFDEDFADYLIELSIPLGWICSFVGPWLRFHVVEAAAKAQLTNDFSPLNLLLIMFANTFTFSYCNAVQYPINLYLDCGILAFECLLVYCLLIFHTPGYEQRIYYILPGFGVIFYFFSLTLVAKEYYWWLLVLAFILHIGSAVDKSFQMAFSFSTRVSYMQKQLAKLTNKSPPVQKGARTRGKSKGRSPGKRKSPKKLEIETEEEKAERETFDFWNNQRPAKSLNLYALCYALRFITIVLMTEDKLLAVIYFVLCFAELGHMKRCAQFNRLINIKRARIDFEMAKKEKTH